MNPQSSRPGTAFIISDVSDLARAVRFERRRNGLKQSDLAGLSGTGPRFISELERGKETVALNKVMAVLNVLGLRLLMVERGQ